MTRELRRDKDDVVFSLSHPNSCYAICTLGWILILKNPFECFAWEIRSFYQALRCGHSFPIELFEELLTNRIFIPGLLSGTVSIAQPTEGSLGCAVRIISAVEDKRQRQQLFADSEDHNSDTLPIWYNVYNVPNFLDSFLSLSLSPGDRAV